MPDSPKEFLASELKRALIVAVLIPLISGIAYLGAFVYRLSWVSFFGIPRYFVRVDTATIIIAWFFIFVVCLLGATIVWLIVDFDLDPFSRSLIKRVLFAIVIAVLFGFVVLVMGARLSTAGIFIIAMALSLGFVFGYWGSEKAQKRFKASTLARFHRSWPEDRVRMMDRVPKYVKKLWLGVVLAVMILGAMAQFGESGAKKRTDFLVLPSQASPFQGSELVILYSDGHFFLGAPLCKQPKHKVERTFVRLDRPKLDSTPLHLESVGPLSPLKVGDSCVTPAGHPVKELHSPKPSENS